MYRFITSNHIIQAQPDLDIIPPYPNHHTNLPTPFSSYLELSVLNIPALCLCPCFSLLLGSSNTTLFIGPPTLESAICALAPIPSATTPIPYAPAPMAIAVRTTLLMPRRIRAKRPAPGCEWEEDVYGCSCWEEAYEYALWSNAGADTDADADVGFCFWKCSGSGRAVVCGGSLT